GLLGWYKKQGFWDVVLLQRKYSLLDDNEQYCLELVIDQGKQRFLAEVEVVGHESFGDLARVGKPVPFSFDLLAQQELVIFNRMRALGFLYPKIKYELQELEQGYRVVWLIHPGATVTFGKTIIRGYTTVPTELLHKAFSYKVGDLWDKEKVQISLGQLRSLDIFERVSLQAIHTGKKQSVRDLLLTVQEDDPFEVKVRLGYQQVSKNFAFKKGSSYKVGSTLVWKNPFKKADTVVVDVNVTRFERGISCSYSSPFLFDAPFSTLIKGYAHTYTQPVSVGSNKSLYEAVQQGFLVGLSSRQKKHINTSCSIGFEWMETKNLSEQLAQAMHFKTDLIDKKIPYFFIEPTIFLDLLNDKLNPTKGLFLLGTIKGMLPLKESSYSVKLLLEEGTFVPLGPLTFAHRIRFGHIFRKDFSAIMPPERFYLGGANSLRGYQTDKCPPLGSFLDEAGITQWVAQGGKSMVNVNLEMRFPLGNKPLYGVVFQDFGVLVEDIHTLLAPKKPLKNTDLLSYSSVC
ncbi:MAG: hypothetical protein EBZ47_07455, partial [Chlamydiae bacterium]|nr:hypothetical protein [Chlamydiota bacterium]